MVESKKQILQTEKFFIQIHNAERAEKEKTMWGVKEKTEWRNGVYLTTCESSLQADILESKLRAEGIPCQKKYKGTSNAMEIIMGSAMEISNLFMGITPILFSFFIKKLLSAIQLYNKDKINAIAKIFQIHYIKN